MFYACSNFQNTTSQSVSVLVKALGGIEDGAMLSKASFEVGRPERVFNFSELLTRHGVMCVRVRTYTYHQEEEEEEGKAMHDPTT